MFSSPRPGKTRSAPNPCGARLHGEAHLHPADALARQRVSAAGSHEAGEGRAVVLEGDAVPMFQQHKMTKVDAAARDSVGRRRGGELVEATNVRAGRKEGADRVPEESATNNCFINPLCNHGAKRYLHSSRAAQFSHESGSSALLEGGASIRHSSGFNPLWSRVMAPSGRIPDRKNIQPFCKPRNSKGTSHWKTSARTTAATTSL